MIDKSCRTRPCARPTTLAATTMALSIAAAFPAMAQTPPVATQSTEAVVITGSRIVRRDFDSPSPIITSSKEAMQESGTITIESTLNQLPQFSPSGTSSSGGQGGGARATLDLRGLGDNRNLILLDGRRLPLSSSFGQVDINNIPAGIIDSVETITGGASAVYGSDAMSGVVNFKTLRRFRGLQLDAQYGNTTKEDLRKVDTSLMAGTDFAGGRGNALISFNFTDRQGLPGRKRAYAATAVPSGFIGTGLYVPDAANLPTQAAVNTVFAKYGVAGGIVAPANTLGFNDNGSLFRQNGVVNYLGPTSDGYAIVAGNVRMPVGPQGDLQNSLRRNNAFMKFDFKLTDNATAYAQYLYTGSTAHTNSGGTLTQFGTLTIPLTNPFIPADLRTILASRPNPTAPFVWNARYVGLPPKQWDERYDVAQFLAGVRGTLPVKDWTYDVYASIDENRHSQTQYNAVLRSRVQDLFNAAGGGTSICAGGLNPFGIAGQMSWSQACKDYIGVSAMSSERLTQNAVEGSIQGGLFDVPAGDVRFSVIGDFRRNTYDFRPDSQLAGNNIEAVIGSSPAKGTTSVKELAGELRVPLLADIPFAQSLDLDLGYRHSDYKISGGTNAYKADLEWKPVNHLLFRGGYAHAIRAPNIGELFSAASGNQVQFGSPPAGGEPCDTRSLARTAGGAQLRALCIATGIPASVVDTYIFPTTATATLSSGNLALKPEKADTKTAGVVFTPEVSIPLLKQLSISLDWYDIKIKDAISQVPAGSTLSKCYNLDGSNPGYSASNVFCQLIQRDANGQLVQILAPYLNLGLLKTSGYDVQVDWRAKLGAFGLRDSYGSVGITSALSYLREFKQQALPGDAAIDYSGLADVPGLGSASAALIIRPRWQALTTFRYEIGTVGVNLRWRHIPAMKDITVITRPASPADGVKKYDIADLTGRWDLTDKIQLRGGITNLFNRQPQFVPGNQNLTIAGTYDILGRSYYVGARVNF